VVNKPNSDLEVSRMRIDYYVRYWHFAEPQHGKISKHPVEPSVKKIVGKYTCQNYFNNITMCTALKQ